MKVLMLGWEFPPYISGGLGTACYGLTKAMDEIGTDVLFVLPKPVESEYTSHVKLMSPASQCSSAYWTSRRPGFKHVTLRTVEAGGQFCAYESAQPDKEQLAKLAKLAPQAAKALGLDPKTANLGQLAALGKGPHFGGGGIHYTGDMLSEVERYAVLASVIAQQEEFDVIHAHDWMTYQAGIAASVVSGKPLVIHVHSTEFDRSGENVNQQIYDIERQGMHFAKRVIAVSYLTKNIITSRYGVSADQVEVVYNAIDFNGRTSANNFQAIEHNDKIVLFLGRITMQKGPEYFLGAAKKVLEVMPNVRFIMAGWGDMVRRTIEMAAGMGIGHRVLFTGFLRGHDVERVFQMADLYVMPSVSEPFGIAPLEAMSNDVPVLISKQSGVSEVLAHVLKVDFWDINEMANKIVAVLRHASLHKTLREHGRIEVRKLAWSDSARRCLDVYQQAISTN